MAHERRVRDNFVDGTVTDAPLAFDALVFNSAELAALENIDSTEHAVIVLDPYGDANGPEVAYVTAHTLGDTVATIQRGREGTSGVEHPAATPWVHGPVRSDWQRIVASVGSLPSTGGEPYEGETAWIMNDNKMVVWNGSAWVDIIDSGVWDTFTPSMPGVSLGNATLSGHYRKIGRLVAAQMRVTFGSTTSVTGSVGFGGLPFSCAHPVVGRASAQHGVNVVDLMWPVDSGTSGLFRASAVFAAPGYTFTTPVDNDSPYPWSSGDKFTGSIVYESTS